MNSFEEKISPYNGKGLHSIDIKVLQVNLGLECNQKCSHCHVSASPEREEKMTLEIMRNIAKAAKTIQPDYIDITGGEPEAHPELIPFIKALRYKGHKVQLRTNLTILSDESQKKTIDFFSKNQVKLIGSLPCYQEKNVDKQRGEGSFEKSIKALKKLNASGYGVNKELQLDLVYNPAGIGLPPSQIELEKAYKKELKKHDIVFNKLLTITNMPLGRFVTELKKEEKVEEYNNLLISSFNPDTLDSLMCRHQVNVGWDGTIYDCDFNLAIGLDIDSQLPKNIKDFKPEHFANRRIATGTHCFGCTAGSGSSCSGALS